MHLLDSPNLGKEGHIYQLYLKEPIKMGQPWLHHCDAFGLQMQPLKDETHLLSSRGHTTWRQKQATQGN